MRLLRALAEALHLKGDTNGYISTLEQAQKLFPRDLMPTLALAGALEVLGRRDAAILQYRHAMELQPDDPRIRATVEAIGERFFQMILDTASGKKSKSELHGYGQNEFVPWYLGAVM